MPPPSGAKTPPGKIAIHPRATLNREFADVDEFLRVPIVGLLDVVHFALVLVADRLVLVFGETGSRSQAALENALQGRYPGANRVLISSPIPGLVTVPGDRLTELDAFAVAVTRFRCAWDETTEIRVQDTSHAFLVSVTYRDEKYFHDVTEQIA